MREIKFRGKTYQGKWIYGYCYKVKSLFDSNLFNWFIRNNYEKDEMIIPETLSQYTGLKDKNGVEIYEGDIIRLDDEARKMYSTAGATTEEELCRRDCLVGYKDGSFMFGRNRLQADYFDSYLWLTNEYCEVIGNIYENKELLKKEGK